MVRLLLSGNSSCAKADCLLTLINTNGKREASLFQNNPYHCVLIIDFNDDNRRVVSQFSGLSKQLYVLKDQQLVPCRAQSLRQHLDRKDLIKIPDVVFNKSNLRLTADFFSPQ